MLFIYILINVQYNYNKLLIIYYIHQQNIFFENRANSSLIDQLTEIAC